MLKSAARHARRADGCSDRVAAHAFLRWARAGRNSRWSNGCSTTLLPYVAIALIVLFQPEIRRALAAWTQLQPRALFSSSARSIFDDIVLAAGYFSQNRIGALIAFERDVGLRTYIESGIPLDANLSYDLLLAIFRPGSPLHDGAVDSPGRASPPQPASCRCRSIPRFRINWAPGTAPPSASPKKAMPSAVLVSEQTGAISLAVGGAIELGLTAEQLAERLDGHLTQVPPTMRLPQPPSAPRVAGKSGHDAPAAKRVFLHNWV